MVEGEGLDGKYSCSILIFFFSYRFHQSNDFLYFTGLQEPDSVLIMESDTSSPLPHHKSIIYVAERNPFK